mgnify:CR=1 FL=1
MSFFHQVFFSGFGSPSGAADELPAEEAEETAAPPQDISAEGDTADNENTEDEDKKE